MAQAEIGGELQQGMFETWRRDPKELERQLASL
jgi:hypothetical protein